MGLDIYLYKYENKEESDRKENDYERFSENSWAKAGKYDSLSEAQKEEVSLKNKTFAYSLGLNDYGSDDKLKTPIEINSTIDSDHYFKIGYFRSSYNDGGINRVLKNLGVPDLYEIFDAGDEYTFQPNWEAALKRVNKSISLLSKKLNYSCFRVDDFGRSGLPESGKDALDLFTKEIKKESSFDGYSNGYGHFYPKTPLKVFAIIPGMTEILGHRKCTYIITEGENEWYLRALKIVRETIEYVLSQKDIEKYYLHWSS